MRRYYKKGGKVTKMGGGGLLKPKLTLKPNKSGTGGLFENPAKPIKSFQDTNPITAMGRVANNQGGTGAQIKAMLDPKGIVFRNQPKNMHPSDYKLTEDYKKKKKKKKNAMGMKKGGRVKR